MQPASVLVDGMVAATWTVARERGAATLTVRAFRRLTTAERAEIEMEAVDLLTLLDPGVTHDVTIR